MNLHRYAFAAALVPALFVSAGAETQPRRPSKQYTIEQFMATTSVSGASFSADEKRILFSSNQTGIFNVYTVPVAGGTPTPITTSTGDTTYAVSYFPQRRPHPLHARPGRQRAQPSLRARARTAPRRTSRRAPSSRPASSAGRRRATPSTSRTNERDPKFFDLYRYDAKTYERTPRLQGRGRATSSARVSDDGRWLALRSR